MKAGQCPHPTQYSTSLGLQVPSSWTCNYFIWNRLHCGCQRVGRGGGRESEEEGVGVDMGKSKLRQGLELPPRLKLERHLEKSQVNQLTQICIIRESGPTSYMRRKLWGKIGWPFLPPTVQKCFFCNIEYSCTPAITTQSVN